MLCGFARRLCRGEAQKIVAGARLFNASAGLSRRRSGLASWRATGSADDAAPANSLVPRNYLDRADALGLPLFRVGGRPWLCGCSRGPGGLGWANSTWECQSGGILLRWGVGKMCGMWGHLGRVWELVSRGLLAGGGAIWTVN